MGAHGRVERDVNLQEAFAGVRVRVGARHRIKERRGLGGTDGRPCFRHEEKPWPSRLRSCS
jgi:hypothetical protein